MDISEEIERIMRELVKMDKFVIHITYIENYEKWERWDKACAKNKTGRSMVCFEDENGKYHQRKLNKFGEYFWYNHSVAAEGGVDGGEMEVIDWLGPSWDEMALEEGSQKVVLLVKGCDMNSNQSQELKQKPH